MALSTTYILMDGCSDAPSLVPWAKQKAAALPPYSGWKTFIIGPTQVHVSRPMPHLHRIRMVTGDFVVRLGHLGVPMIAHGTISKPTILRSAPWATPVGHYPEDYFASAVPNKYSTGNVLGAAGFVPAMVSARNPTCFTSAVVGEDGILRPLDSVPGAYSTVANLSGQFSQASMAATTRPVTGPSRVFAAIQSNILGIVDVNGAVHAAFACPTSYTFDSGLSHWHYVPQPPTQVALPYTPSIDVDGVIQRNLLYIEGAATDQGGLVSACVFADFISDRFFGGSGYPTNEFSSAPSCFVSHWAVYTTDGWVTWSFRLLEKVTTANDAIPGIVVGLTVGTGDTHGLLGARATGLSGLFRLPSGWGRYVALSGAFKSEFIAYDEAFNEVRRSTITAYTVGADLLWGDFWGNIPASPLVRFLQADNNELYAPRLGCIASGEQRMWRINTSTFVVIAYISGVFVWMASTDYGATWVQTGVVVEQDPLAVPKSVVVVDKSLLYYTTDAGVLTARVSKDNGSTWTSAAVTEVTDAAGNVVTPELPMNKWYSAPEGCAYRIGHKHNGNKPLNWR